jgi:hypothetical protein
VVQWLAGDAGVGVRSTFVVLVVVVFFRWPGVGVHSGQELGVVLSVLWCGSMLAGCVGSSLCGAANATQPVVLAPASNPAAMSVRGVSRLVCVQSQGRPATGLCTGSPNHAGGVVNSPSNHRMAV